MDEFVNMMRVYQLFHLSRYFCLSNLKNWQKNETIYFVYYWFTNNKLLDFSLISYANQFKKQTHCDAYDMLTAFWTKSSFAGMPLLISWLIDLTF